jgi:erythromycin esterase
MKRLLLLYILLLVTGCLFAQSEPAEKVTFNIGNEYRLPKVNEEWASYVEESAVPIHDLESDNFSDLSFLHDVLKGKRIVMLGESGHGVAEFNILKTRLIKFLHEHLGFEVIAFESGIAECAAMQIKKEKVTADSMMKNSLFHIWHTKQNLELFEYLKNTDSLILTGIDVQLSKYRLFSYFLIDFFRKISEDMALKAYLTESESVYMFRSDPLALFRHKNDYMKKRYELQMSYIELINYLNDNEQKFEKAGYKPWELKMVKRSLFNRVRFFNLHDNEIVSFEEIRDMIMAENLEWMTRYIFPDKKIIVWAHNYHISKYNDIKRVMGAYLSEEIKNISYGIGLYMYSGENALNDKTVVNVRRPTRRSLESIMLQSGYKISFLDISTEKKYDENNWLYKYINTFDYGFYRRKEFLSKSFDGLILIDRVSVPDYF